MIRKAWQRWLWFSEKIGAVQSRVILGVFYFTIFLPVGLIYRLIADPLKIKEPSIDTNWQPKDSAGVATIKRSKLQF